MSWGAKQYDNQHNKPYRESESTHHRKPRSLGGTNQPRNIIELPRSRHAAWHTLFSNLTPDRIAAEINARYLDPDYELVAVRRNHEKVAHIGSHRPDDDPLRAA